MATRLPAEGPRGPRAQSPVPSTGLGMALDASAGGCVQSWLILWPPETSRPGSLSIPPVRLMVWVTLCLMFREVALCWSGLLAAQGFVETRVGRSWFSQAHGAHGGPCWPRPHLGSWGAWPAPCTWVSLTEGRTQRL